MYEKPNREARKKYEENQRSKPQQVQDANTASSAALIAHDAIPITFQNQSEQFANRAESIKASADHRVFFRNNKISGSINLKGARIDDLTLVGYKITQKDSEPIHLLSPSGAENKYFAEFGFISKIQNIDLPTGDTIWDYSGSFADKTKPVVLSWTNKVGVKFSIQIQLDENYLFRVTQTITNPTQSALFIAPYSRVYRIMPKQTKSSTISHEGVVSFFGDQLHEYSYKEMREKTNLRSQSYEITTDSWTGISDQYWLTALIPTRYECQNSNCDISQNSNTLNTQVRFLQMFEGGIDRYQVDYTFPFKEIAPSQANTTEIKLFAGSKEIAIIDKYMKTHDIKQFDKSVDFGILYFLTKPLFLFLHFINSHTKNFGISIILLTLIVKIILFPLSTKSYISMMKMKALAPRIQNIKEKYGAIKADYHKQIVNLYRTEGVNPMSGCLPILLQIPIFFALYKVLYISIEMRHAPFFFWIKDLSAPDPTSIFNLFGLLPYSVPSILSIGVLPIVFGISMFLQQSLTPKTGGDAVQMQVMKYLPIFMTIIFSGFASGLVLYWISNNTLSILQQLLVEKIYKTSSQTKQS